MDTAGSVPRRYDDLRPKIVLAAVVIIALMLLFPPKYSGQRMPLTGQTVTQSNGYQFILSDPSGAQKAAAVGMPDEMAREMFFGGVEYGKLLIQIAVVAGLAYAAYRFLAAGPPPGG
jgi:hypothetical protein